MSKEANERRKRGTQYVTLEVYYESIKRELNKRLIFDCRCDARLKAKVEGCTRLTYTMWREEP
jgi:hypothetical protein